MSIEVIETDTGHYYEVDGERMPGVSEVLESADVFLKNSFYEEAREAAAERGKEVHLACADLDNGGPDWWSASDIEPYVNAYKLFKADYSFRASVIEEPRFHEVYRYCCTPDRYGIITTPVGDSRTVTVELKAVAKIYPHVDLQLAAQNLMCDDYEDREPFAVQLKDNGKYSIHWVKDKQACERVFLAALTLFNWKRSNNVTR